MTAICLLDTSVFVEILAQLGERIRCRESLFLPMATILETGNHIGQNGDGHARRRCAQRFVREVSTALAGQSSFKPISFLQATELQAWLSEFPDHAMSRAAWAIYRSFTIGSACVHRITGFASISGRWTITCGRMIAQLVCLVSGDRIP